MEFKVGDKAFYHKVLGDKTSIELVDIVHIDTETKSVTIYIPSLKRERDTELARLMKRQLISYSNAKIEYKLPKRNILDTYFVGQTHPKNLKEILYQDRVISGFSNMPINKDCIKYSPPYNGNTDRTQFTEMGVFNGLRELYTEVDTLYESIDVLYKNQLILDKKITSVKNELVEEIKSLKDSLSTQTEINKNVELKELHDKINPPVMIKTKKTN